MRKRFGELLQMSTFSERLRDRARELGWSQRALAKAAGVSSAHVSRMFDGSRSAAPSYPIVVRLADALGVPDRWLFWGDDFGVDDVNAEHNKNIALSIARAGAISEGVLSTVSSEKFDGPSQPSVLWWIQRILALNTLAGLPSPLPHGAVRQLPIDNDTNGKHDARMVTKGFVEFSKRLTERGAQARMAEVLGVRPAVISKIRARGSCGADLMIKIESACGIPARWWREPVAVEEVAR